MEVERRSRNEFSPAEEYSRTLEVVGRNLAAAQVAGG